MADTSHTLDLTSSWLNAAGMLGFAPHKGWPKGLDQGAFVTNPISLKPRHPASNRACLPFPGGFVLHTGWPNPGLKAAIRKYSSAWTRSSIPVWVHVITNEANELQSMIRSLEEVEGVMAVELSLPPGITEGGARDLVHRGVGELPLVVELPLNAVGAEWLSRIAEWGASALSLGALRGTLVVDGKTVTGRIYGPCVLPVALQAMESLKSMDIPVIAGGGIYRKIEGEAFLQAGAAGVKLDTVLWQGQWE